jgi:hypothetical protein
MKRTRDYIDLPSSEQGVVANLATVQNHSRGQAAHLSGTGRNRRPPIQGKLMRKTLLWQRNNHFPNLYIQPVELNGATPQSQNLFRGENKPSFFPYFSLLSMLFKDTRNFRFKVFFHLFVLTLNPILPRRLHLKKKDSPLFIPIAVEIT